IESPDIRDVPLIAHRLLADPEHPRENALVKNADVNRVGHSRRFEQVESAAARDDADPHAAAVDLVQRMTQLVRSRKFANLKRGRRGFQQAAKIESLDIA